MNETCSHCNASVAPGSGRFANRIPDGEGGFICAECTAAIFTPDPAELAQEILQRLGGDPAQVIYSVNRQDIANTLAEQVLQGEMDLDALSDEELEIFFQAGLTGAEEIDWQTPIRNHIEQAWSAQFYRPSDPFEDGDHLLVEEYENAARLGDDGWLEAAYEDRYGDY
jgi:hypothetical protein